jgi:molybdate transport system regulatory protein
MEGVVDDRSSGTLFGVSEHIRVLDSAQLEELEQAFRAWVESTGSRSYRFARRRVLLVFLLIRYAGIKLGEALGLNESEDIDLGEGQLRLSKRSTGSHRILPLPDRVVEELASLLGEELSQRHKGALLSMDQGYVRKRFYQLAEKCGLPKELGSPEVIRKSRGVELLRGGMPLPVVQKVLGHSTPALAAEYLDFSEEEVRKAVRHYMTRETRRKTSARNSFYGKVTGIERGDIQSTVTLRSIGGHEVSAVITNSSLNNLGLQKGVFVTALVKAPWVIVNRDNANPSLVNCYQGAVSGIEQGRLSTELTVRLVDGTEICAVITEKSRSILAFRIDDRALISFSEFAVIINME